MPKDKPKGDSLINEVRENYDYALNEWSDTRQEGRTDMRYISGDPWDPTDRQARKDAGRPIITCDEINQYCNQSINTVRQNPRGIKINPAGNGATDKTAEFHQNLIRGIEYKSQAFRLAYIPAFENALQRSYGFFRISRGYVKGKSFDQEILIKGIQNPDTVVYDPDCKEVDWADANFCYVTEPIRRKEFKSKYPGAKVVDFTGAQMKDAPNWIREDSVLTAEYWKAKKSTRELLMIDGGEAGQIVAFKDELPSLEGLKIIKSRPFDDRKVVQYITNGLEILEETEQLGPYIPIIPVIGKQLFVDDGSGSKRILMSLVRLARDPYMLYCYLCSQEAEEAGLTPKTPFIGYKGQFESDSEAWETINKIPRAYIQVDPIVDAATGQVLPKPDRQPFQPNFQAYEVAKDSARRAIQAAMGINPLPTAAQRNNEKSGAALRKIQEQESIGSFHFTDNFDRSMEFGGRVIESWIPNTYNTEREVGIRKPDESHSVIRINTATPYKDAEGTDHHYPVDVGDHDVTVSVGPSYQSQREAADDFITTFIQNIEALPLAPEVKARAVSLMIRLKSLGPLGDELADLLDPQQDNNPQQMMAQMQKLKQNADAMHAYAQQVEAQVQKLQAEKQGKVVEGEYKLKLASIEQEVKILVAEIGTKAQKESERDTLFADMFKTIQQMAHERGMQAADHAHEADQAQVAAQNQSALSAQSAAQGQEAGV